MIWFHRVSPLQRSHSATRGKTTVRPLHRKGSGKCTQLLASRRTTFITDACLTTVTTLCALAFPCRRDSARLKLICLTRGVPCAAAYKRASGTPRVLPLIRGGVPACRRRGPDVGQHLANNVIQRPPRTQLLIHFNASLCLRIQQTYLLTH